MANFGWYILGDDPAVPIFTEDMQAGARFFADHSRRVVDRTQVRPGVEVSTVFLCHDHDFSGLGPPVLWETMIFGGPLDQDTRRYTSRADAVQGHAEMVERATNAIEAGSGSE